MIAVATFCLIGCATTQQSKSAQISQVPYESTYDIVGYRFIYRVNDGNLTFNYIDSLSDAEIKQAADTIIALVPEATSYEVAAPGQLKFKLTSAISQAKFDAFVEEMNNRIYNAIY